MKAYRVNVNGNTYEITLEVIDKAEIKTPAPKAVMSASGEYMTYTVQSGDSFYLIAKRYPGVSAQNIMDYNGIDSSKLRPGMKIKIPVIK